MGKSQTNYYVKPDDFHEEYKISLIKGKPTTKLLLMFEKIAKKYSTKFRGNKLDIDSCVNYALTEAWKKWDKYDEERSTNIFAFFTQMIKNDLAQHHNKIFHKKELYVSIDALFTNQKDL
jgi:hypothetical protein